jgi:hypothetical protein
MKEKNIKIKTQEESSKVADAVDKDMKKLEKPDLKKVNGGQTFPTGGVSGIQ